MDSARFALFRFYCVSDWFVCSGGRHCIFRRHGHVPRHHAPSGPKFCDALGAAASARTRSQNIEHCCVAFARKRCCQRTPGRAIVASRTEQCCSTQTAIFTSNVDALARANALRFGIFSVNGNRARLVNSNLICSSVTLALRLVQWLCVAVSECVVHWQRRVGCCLVAEFFVTCVLSNSDRTIETNARVHAQI